MNLKIKILYIVDLLIELFAGHTVPIGRDQAREALRFRIYNIYI